MVEAMAPVLVVILIASLLYFMPSYFRRLRLLTELLQSEHPEIYEQLHRPSISFRDSTIRSSQALLHYIISRDYRFLGSERANKLGNAALWRLVANCVVFVAVFIFISAIPVE